MEFWQTKLPEQEQLDEQNPPKEPELAGQLDARIKIKLKYELILNHSKELIPAFRVLTCQPTNTSAQWWTKTSKRSRIC